MDYPAKLDWKDTYQTARHDAQRRGYAGAEMTSGMARAFVDRTKPKGESVLAYRVGAYQVASGFLTRADLLRQLRRVATSRADLQHVAPDSMARARIVADAKRAILEARICRDDLADTWRLPH